MASDEAEASCDISPEFLRKIRQPSGVPSPAPGGREGKWIGRSQRRRRNHGHARARARACRRRGRFGSLIDGRVRQAGDVGAGGQRLDVCCAEKSGNGSDAAVVGTSRIIPTFPFNYPNDPEVIGLLRVRRRLRRWKRSEWRIQRGITQEEKERWGDSHSPKGTYNEETRGGFQAEAFLEEGKGAYRHTHGEGGSTPLDDASYQIE
ncbi:hypothetical protein M5K25_010027 [Dendrobium thyrsiflorum]|uniref:Uncharacterized protein n=1 Tax=Dendrobium thyrsiflorum TaxID=117978 RepID=A0ABD0UZJ7_DENTH